MIEILGAIALQTAQPSDLQPFEVQGFRTQIIVAIDAPRETVFDVATGDISRWWDHTFYPDPAELVIEPVLGGRFYERFEAGKDDGVIHADVISVYRPQMLRLDGPLGLSGRAFEMVTTWTLGEDEAGEQTRFTVDIAMMGEMDAELGEIVRSVWVHFIEGRLKLYIEADCHTEPEQPCSALETAD